MSEGREGDRLVAEVISEAGGRIVGRVRLQKVFYLLDRLGLNSGFSYDYHHYGPYSADLAEAVQDATAFGLIEEKTERRKSDGVPYSVFERSPIAPDQRMEGLSLPVAAPALADMQRESATVLELAATIDWLRAKEHVVDWRAELIRRKGPKADPARVERAVALVRRLGLDHYPVTSPSAR